MSVPPRMNGVRIDLMFSGNAPTVSFPCLVRRIDASILILIGNDTPLLRARLIEVLLANPEVQMAVSPCFFATVAQFRNPHEMVREAMEGAAPTPLSFSITGAAKRLGISYTQIRRLIRLGRIKKVNGRVTSAEIARYLQEPRRK